MLRYNRKGFEDEMKNFFVIFEGISIKEITQIFLIVRVQLSEVKAIDKVNSRN